MNISQSFANKIEFINDLVQTSNKEKTAEARTTVVSINTRYDIENKGDWGSVAYSIMQIAKKYSVQLKIDASVVRSSQDQASLVVHTDLIDWDIKNIVYQPTSVCSELFYLCAQQLMIVCQGVNEFPRAVQERFTWTQKNADTYSFHEDLCSVAVYYEKGLGTPRSVEKAFEYYKKAAERGNYFAQRRLYSLYLGGIGVTRSQQMALQWQIRAAATMKDKIERPLLTLIHSRQPLGPTTRVFMIRLWSIYVIEKYATEDIGPDRALIEKAAAVGIPEAQFNVAKGYQSHDDKKALSWFLKAAEGGMMAAQFIVGKCYEQAIGTVRNRHQAREWYSKAAVQGHEEAHQCYDALTKKYYQARMSAAVVESSYT